MKDKHNEEPGDLRSRQIFALETLKANVALQIKDAMDISGISKQDLAQKLGKSERYINKLLAGRVNLALDMLVKISQAINARPTAYLVTKNSDRQIECIQSEVETIIRAGILEGQKAIYSIDPTVYKEFMSHSMMNRCVLLQPTYLRERHRLTQDLDNIVCNGIEDKLLT